MEMICTHQQDYGGVPKGAAVLTKDFLLNTPKEHRQQEVFFHIVDHQLDRNVSELFEQVSVMRKEYQMIYTIWHLQGEVNNGGYYQYFSNFESCNQITEPYYDLTLDCLKMVGRADFGDDFSRALSLYKKSEECGGDNPFAEKIEMLDWKYYENEDRLIQAIDVYVDAHLDEFAT